MASSLTKTKRRIHSIEETEKTTKAMELIASVKARRLRTRYDASLDYVHEYRDLMGYLFGQAPETLSHYGRENDRSLPTLYIAIGSSMGLCGAYNANMGKLIERSVKPTDVLAPVGAKLLARYASDPRFPNVSTEFVSLGEDLSFESMSSLAKRLKDLHNEGRYRRIVLLYTHYVNSISFVPISYLLLPVKIGKGKWPGEEYCPPLMAGGANRLVHRLLPEYLMSALYGVFVESALSEQASRRSAMDAANDNADELLNRLSIEYNKARQSAITQEIVEVIGGSN